MPIRPGWLAHSHQCLAGLIVIGHRHVALESGLKSIQQINFLEQAQRFRIICNCARHGVGLGAAFKQNDVCAALTEQVGKHQTNRASTHDNGER